MSTEAVRIDSPTRRPVRAVLIGTVVAMVEVFAIGTTARAGCSHLLATLVARLTALRRWFLVVAVVGLVGYFASAFAGAEQPSIALWLCLIHIVVAAAPVPIRLRALPAGA